jgi:3-oxoacyl-[acyl-carrier-protein] synthase III
MMRIRAIRHAVPGRRVTNQDLVDAVLRRSTQLAPAERDELALRITGHLEASGARRRFHRAPGERAIDFAIAAGRAAIDAADIDPEDIQLLIFVGVGRGFVEPATASVLQPALGLARATCFDILDACASWLRGLEIAHLYLSSGRARNAMLVNCEFNFQEYVPLEFASLPSLDHVWAGFTIGEAATAAVVSADGPDDFHARFSSAGEHNDLCRINLPHAAEFVPGNHVNGWKPLTFYSNSKRLNYHAIQQLTDLYAADARARDAAHDIIFGHSASVPAALAVAERLGLDIRKHFDVFPEYGNTVSASLPLAMSLACDEGRLERGQRVLLLMASAGITTGYATFTF